MSAIQICVTAIYLLGIPITAYLMTRYDGVEIDKELIGISMATTLWPFLLPLFLIYTAGKLGEKHRSKK